MINSKTNRINYKEKKEIYNIYIKLRKVIDKKEFLFEKDSEIKINKSESVFRLKIIHDPNVTNENIKS